LNIINCKNTTIPLVLFLIVALILINSQIIEAQQSCFPTQWPYELSDLVPDPDITRGRLSNGLRYLIKYNNEPKNRVAIYLDVQAGAFQETNEQRGVAHFLEHMMFNGSTHFPPGSLIEYFQSIGMGFGSDINAHTSYNETVYHLILPDGSKEHLENGLLVMADYARGALLLESEIDRERGVILAEKRARDSASYRTRVADSSFAFRGTRIPERRVIGIDTVLEKADRKLLKSYYDSWYRPDNMVLVIVGNIELKKTEKLLAELFSPLNTASAVFPKCPEFGHLNHRDIETFYHFEPELGYTGVSIEVLWDVEPENDTIALEKTELIRQMGSIILQYRLKQLKEMPEIPFTHAGHHYGNIAGRIGYALIATQTEADDWEKSLTLISKILRQAYEFGFYNSEVDRVKKEILAELDSAVLQEKNKDSRHIAQNVIRHINSNRVYQSAEQEQELYTQLLGEINAEDVAREFKKIWGQNNRLISVTGDVQLGKTAKNTIRTVFESSLIGSVAAYYKKDTERFPYLLPPESIQNPIRIELFPEIGVEKIVFENGLILNLKKTDFADNKFQLAVNYGYGELAEPVPGMSMLAEDVINRSGSSNLTKTELDAILSGSSVDVRFSIRESSFLWSGSGLKKDFNLLITLLNTLFFDPGFRKNVFDSVMADTEQIYKKIERDIDGAIPLKVQSFFASDNPHFGMPPWKIVRAIDYEQLSSWAQNIAPGHGMEVSVVGDFDREQVIQSVKKYFSSIELAKCSQIQPTTAVFPESERIVVEVNTSISKSLIVVAWPTDDRWNISRTRRLHILAAVFEDRIRKRIREKLGATYSPEVYSSNSRVYKGYGFLATQMMVKPGEEEKIIDEIIYLADELRLKGVTEEELMRAKKPVLTSIGDNLKRNSYWLYTVLSESSRFPEQLDWPQTILPDYSSITTKEINILSKKYMDNTKAAIAIVKPGESGL